MSGRETLLLLVASLIGLSLTSCTLLPTVNQSANCEVLRDPFFEFTPSIDKELNPWGYFNEVVTEQERFVGVLESLKPESESEKSLLEGLVSTNQELLRIYKVQLTLRIKGETALDFQDRIIDSGAIGKFTDQRQELIDAMNADRSAWTAFGDSCGAISLDR
jgi:hypothetical protein